MSPRTHVGRRLLPPIFLPNIGHNQSASRIIALTFLTKNVSNESAFFVQTAHPYRAFLRTHIRINFRVPTALTVPGVPTVPIALTVPISLRVFLRLSKCLQGLESPMALIVSRSPTASIALTLSSKNNPSLRYLYLNQRRYYFVWLHKVLEIYIFITLWIPVLYHNNYPYYPNRNKGIELFVVSIIIIGIYDSRWRVFSRPRLPAIARKYRISFLFKC